MNKEFQSPVIANKKFMVHPCIIDGKQTLIYERGFEKQDPQSFQNLSHYARESGYIIKEDRRANFLQGVKRVKDPSRANVISVLILTASLLSQNAAADYSNYLGLTTPISEIEQMQVYPSVDLEMSSFSTVEQLMAGLVDWIDEHTSFDHDIDKLPGLVFANPHVIAEVAFGGDLPGNIDASSLNILGLYNFNDKAIYILDSLDMESEEGKGILLHELVHYLQYEDNINENVECKNELEALAYLLEAKYLNDKSIEHNISQKHIDKVSECRD